MTQLFCFYLLAHPHPTSYCLGSGPESWGGIRCKEEEEQEEVGVEWISIWRGWEEVENVE